MAMLKGWTFGSSDGRPRGKQGKESRKLGGREEGEPPEAEEGGGKPREGGRNTRGEAEKSRQGSWDRRDGEVGEVGVEESGLRAGECRYWARRPRERTMVKSEAGAGKPEPGGRGRSRNKTAKGGKTRR
jgi:hypothetical protein